jgi:hypothetical protein
MADTYTTNEEIEDLKQLVTFYRQRASELEMQVLQSQLKINRLTANQEEPKTDTMEHL